MRTVGYLGPTGTFSEEAAYRYFTGEEVVWQVYPSIPDVLDGLNQGLVTDCVVPIENSIEGPIHATLDTLLQNSALYVHGEIILSVSLHLLAQPTAHLEGIREVWSIPPALAQCRGFLRPLGVETTAHGSTAGAAAAVKESNRDDVAAVASEWAGSQFGLVSLAKDIQDASANHTRFLILSKTHEAPVKASKTMLSVLPNHEHSGVLASILNIFAALNLNLSWIVSRPTRTRLGTYQFVLDLDAGWSDSRLAKAISVLQTLEHSVRVLGSYESRS